MRIFKAKRFNEWAHSENITDNILIQISHEVAAGLVEANLGSNLYKKRLALNGRGKRGGYRTLLAFRRGSRIVFLYGFSKNEKQNITEREQEVFTKLANQYLRIEDKNLEPLIKKGELIEINIRRVEYEQEKESEQIEEENELAGSRTRNGAGII